MIKKKIWITIKFILLTFLIISCSSTKNQEISQIKEKTDIEIYNNALSLSIIGKHNKAALEFELISVSLVAVPRARRNLTSYLV